MITVYKYLYGQEIFDNQWLSYVAGKKIYLLWLKLKLSKIWLVIRHEFLAVRVINQLNNLPKERVDAPFFADFKLKSADF